MSVLSPGSRQIAHAPSPTSFGRSSRDGLDDNDFLLGLATSPLCVHLGHTYEQSLAQDIHTPVTPPQSQSTRLACEALEHSSTLDTKGEFALLTPIKLSSAIMNAYGAFSHFASC